MAPNKKPGYLLACVGGRHSVLEAAQGKYDEDPAEERPEPEESGTRRDTKREILIRHDGKKALCVMVVKD